MKKILLPLLLLFSIVTFSQALTEGTYIGLIQTDEDQYKVTFKVVDGKVSEVGTDNLDATVTKHSNGTTLFTWMNSGGVWNETQTFIFNKGSDEYIHLNFLRVVKNEGEDPWTVSGVGLVKKEN